MVYKFRILSDEVDDFYREIDIDSDATFLDLHKAIQQSAGYTDDQLTSFFTCDEDWNKETEITLEDMGNSSSDVDVYIMGETQLSELLEDEKQKLIYVFDPLSERVLFMELSGIITGKNLIMPKVVKSIGQAPSQTINYDEQANLNTNFDTGENFYGDEDYDLDDIDTEGYDFGGGGGVGDSFDDDRF